MPRLIHGNGDLMSAAKGSVIQVQNLELSQAHDDAVTTANSFDFNTNFQLNITPFFANSKILIECHVYIVPLSTSTVASGRIVRITGGVTTQVSNDSAGSSDTTTGSMVVYADNASVNYMGNNCNSLSFFDSPNTTAQCTYRLQIAGNTASTSVGFGQYGFGESSYGGTWIPTNTMTLMEIRQ
tara:strand:+ start:274 stop:822 length:549 start_codon:yes stop_codon:yes gene_type:complete